MRIAICANRQGTAPPPHATMHYEAEWDTPSTIEAVAQAVRQEHECVGVIEADVHAFEALRCLRPALVFNMAECAGGRDREGRIPAMLEMLGIPYTGSDPVTLGMGLDKALYNHILRAAGLPVPSAVVVHQGGALPAVAFPAIVKPVHEGSGIGIHASSLVYTPQEVQREVRRIHTQHGEAAVIEAFLPGREFTVALLGNGPSLHVLPVLEILLENLPAGVPRLYSYEAKWLYDTPAHPLDLHACPAQISPTLQDKLVAGSRHAFTALGCRDWCRIDWRCDRHGQPHILEVNALPGLIPAPEAHSCFPTAARAAGMTFDELILSIIETAARRYGLV
ncbi:MAG: D-alanine--D-alanine ligase [Candidatus Tectomicrobia bacterium]|uniref:D-alanine--D-alanine ligase n=1 Tax=Tectimicrobiota bacterium TaxID=2528274 RepID=A0A937W5Y9_UNCTE|nr:D-alanine--D-alanine ligase [Candidatus Tectomicrobia bacterium]